MSADILTVPGDWDGLTERHKALFPTARIAYIRGPMVGLRGDKPCGCRYEQSDKDAKPAEHDIDTADRCGECGSWVPWSDVTSGASARAVRVDGCDVRLCATCTAERAS